MIRKRGKLRRGLIVIGSAGGSIGDLALGMWRADASRRWLLPLAIFLCMTGLLLALAASVEALAPFIYSIF
jgi:ABC-type phosphate transport system permease subunit